MACVQIKGKNCEYKLRIFATDIQELQCVVPVPACPDEEWPPRYRCVRGHPICSSCIGKAQVCPVCRIDFPKGKDPILNALAAHIPRSECPNAGFGCKVERRTPQEIQKHVPDCQYGETECPNSKFGCEVTTRKPEKIQDHLRDCEYGETECPNSKFGCEFATRKPKQIQGHLRGCEYGETECPNSKFGCKIATRKPKLIQDHLRDCEYGETECPNLKFGCKITTRKPELIQDHVRDCNYREKECPNSKFKGNLPEKIEDSHCEYRNNECQVDGHKIETAKNSSFGDIEYGETISEGPKSGELECNVTTKKPEGVEEFSMDGYYCLMGCTNAITKQDLSSHLKNDHMMDVVESCEVEIVQKLDKHQEFLPIAFSVFDEHFFLTSKISEGNVMWQCIVVGPKDISQQFSAQITIANYAENWETKWQGPVSSVDELQENQIYLAIPLSNVQIYNNSTSDIVECNLRVCIKKGQICKPAGNSEIKRVEMRPSLSTTGESILENQYGMAKYIVPARRHGGSSSSASALDTTEECHSPNSTTSEPRYSSFHAYQHSVDGEGSEHSEHSAADEADWRQGMNGVTRC